MHSMRKTTALAAVTALAFGAVGCSSGSSGSSGSSSGGSGQSSRQHDGPAAAVQKPPARVMKLIGDGSTAETGAQPNQPKFERLAPGEKPPQFVVFSWDGAGEDSQKLFSHFREVGKENNAAMTYFLSGVYLLPGDRKEVYAPPRHSRGASDIGFTDRPEMTNTLQQIRLAWQDGSEIGTHFNGHFCGPNGGVGTWSSEEWKSEIEQAEGFVKNWKTNSGLTQLAPLPFDYSKELVGGRAPCLEGQRNLIPAAKEMGFRYDASSVGGRQVWPSQIDGVWDFPLQDIPVPGRAFETLSMDYNFLANQSGTTKGDPSMRDYWGRQMENGLAAAFDRAYTGNRAPMFVGNHFESWNGGVYMKAVESTIKSVCNKDGVRCVSFKQMADWMDAQDPAVLQKLRTLDVGQAPKEGWPALLAAPAAPGAPAVPGAPAAPGAAASAGAAGPGSKVS